MGGDLVTWEDIIGHVGIYKDRTEHLKGVCKLLVVIDH